METTLVFLVFLVTVEGSELYTSKHAWSTCYESILYDYIPTYIVYTSIHPCTEFLGINFCGWRQPQTFPLTEIFAVEVQYLHTENARLSVPPHAASAQVHLSSPMAGGRACYKYQFEMTCWYPEVINGRYLVQSPGWKVNGSKLILDETTYQEQRINSTATKVIVTVTDAFSVNTDLAYSCFLVLPDTRLDESTQQVHVHIMG